VFGPVWTILYTLIAVAAWLVWRERDSRSVKPALGLMIIQLAANSLWTWIFFAWRKGGWAFGEIVVLWILIAGTTAAFWRIRTVAGALFLPYLAWVSFAAALTYSVWQRNPLLL
jgi:tryptophan-rich sensory protein